MPKTSRIGLFSWALFDWANSGFPTVITTFIFATYFTQAIAKNSIIGTAQWGYAVAIAGVFIAVLSPILGAIADQDGRRKIWIACFAVITALSAVMLWFALPSPAFLYWALLWVILGTVGFEVSAVFYNAMMRDLVTKEYLGRLSGWGWGMGYAGGLACLSTALFLMHVHWLDKATAEQVRICGPLVALWLIIFGLPFFIFTPDQPKKINGIPVKQGLATLVQTLRNLRHYREIFKFLIARMIYIDGLNTLFAFGGIYAAGTFGLTLQDVIKFGIAMNVAAALGAVIFAWLDDIFGAKKIVLLALIAMVIFGTSLLLIHSLLWFWILGMCLSLFIGPVQAASRSLMTHITPPECANEMFGLYALSGKATAFMGPWLVGLMTYLFDSQRAGMSVVMVFMLVGGVLLSRVKCRLGS